MLIADELDRIGLFGHGTASGPPGSRSQVSKTGDHSETRIVVGTSCEAVARKLLDHLKALGGPSWYLARRRSLGVGDGVPWKHEAVGDADARQQCRRH